MNITLPTGMGLKDWADQVSLDLDPYGSFGKLVDENDWQTWAVKFMNNMTLKENIPVPYHFDNWRDWAERFCQVLA